MSRYKLPIGRIKTVDFLISYYAIVCLGPKRAKKVTKWNTILFGVAFFVSTMEKL